VRAVAWFMLGLTLRIAGAGSAGEAVTVPSCYPDPDGRGYWWDAGVWVSTHDSYGPTDREDEPARGYSLSAEDRAMLARLAADLEREELERE
jgi:hypothetical protein